MGEMSAVELRENDRVWIINAARNRAHPGKVMRVLPDTLIVLHELKGEEYPFDPATGRAAGQYLRRGEEAWTDDRRPEVVPFYDQEALTLVERQAKIRPVQIVDEAAGAFRRALSEGTPTEQQQAYAGLVLAVAEWGATALGLPDPRRNQGLGSSGEEGEAKEG